MTILLLLEQHARQNGKVSIKLINDAHLVDRSIICADSIGLTTAGRDRYKVFTPWTAVATVSIIEAETAHG